MTVVSIDIPENIKTKFGIGNEITYDMLIMKTLGKEYFPIDLQFTEYENMSKNHQIEFDKLNNIDKAKLINI